MCLPKREAASTVSESGQGRPVEAVRVTALLAGEGSGVTASSTRAMPVCSRAVLVCRLRTSSLRTGAQVVRYISRVAGAVRLVALVGASRSATQGPEVVLRCLA